MSRSKIILGLIAAALCAALIIVLSIAVRRTEGRVGRFPDGTVVHLENYSHGTEHVLKGQGDAWWQAFFPPRELTRESSDRAALALWLRVARPTAPRSARPPAMAVPPPGLAAAASVVNPVSDWWDWAEVADERGDRIRTVNNDSPNARIPNGTCPLQVTVHSVGKREYDCLQLLDYPRRGKTVTLRLYVYGRQKPCAQFTVPNPTPGPYPRWTPQSLPVDQRQGAVTASLVSLSPAHDAILRTSPNSYASRNIKPATFQLLPGEVLATNLEFRFAERGKPTSAWQYAGTPLLFDATGNKYWAILYSTPAHGRVGVSIQLPDSSPEAHKMRIALARTSDAALQTSAERPVRNVILAKAGKFVASHASVTYHGYTIRILGTAGPGQVQYPTPSRWPNDVGALQSDAPSLRIQVTPPDRFLRIFLQAVDDRGRSAHTFLSPGETGHPWLECQEARCGYDNIITSFSSLSPQNTSSFGLQKIQEETFFLNIPPGARSLNLTLGMTEVRTFDFLLPSSTHP